MTYGEVVGPVPSQSATDAEATSLYARVTWRVVPILCAGFLIAYIDRANVGFAKLQMLGDLKFSESAYGLGAGLFFLGYILFEIPSNIALRHVGARAWIGRIMISWGVLSGATMFASTPGAFYTLRFLLGVAEAGFFPGVLYYFTIWYPAKRRSRITALFMLGIPLSGMVGSPLSGWIMTDFQGFLGLAGWQWLFLVEAIPAIGLGVIICLALPSSIAGAKWLTEDEKRYLAEELEGDLSAGDVHLLLGALKDMRIWLVGVIDCAILFGMYAIIFWLPTIVRGTGLISLKSNGLVTAVPHLAGIVAMIAVGWSSDRLRERRWHVALPMMMAAAAFAASGAFSGNLTATIVLFAIANAGLVGALPPLLCIPGTFLRGAAAAAGLALVSSIGNLAGLTSTYLIGRLMDTGHTAGPALAVFAAFLVVGALVTLGLPAKLVNR